MAEKVNRDMLVAQYRAMYPAGTVLELTAPINDEYTPKDVGNRFIVSGVDDIGQIHGVIKNGNRQPHEDTEKQQPGGKIQAGLQLYR